MVNLTGTPGAVSVAASWDNPGFATGYNARVTLGSTHEVYSATLPANVTSLITGNGLMTGSPHEVTVTAFNSFGTGPATTISVTTPGMIDSCDGPMR